jgi:hypothetical protein
MATWGQLVPVDVSTTKDLWEADTFPLCTGRLRSWPMIATRQVTKGSETQAGGKGPSPPCTQCSVTFQRL